ncbi:MHS family MFS transporter [Bradyrhizobium sp. 168]|uniref:MFS transporter n=2 Tax=Bradyrhizobium TaxID=374 RepID=UPI0020586043|nr:MHS family MFS transporter [Bradyrhizobium sp. 30]MCK1310070.1 MHS family MFS transporter [Bradyrhizobium sp. 45]MCK1332519.1 MHS family MFS transporter [Bradyrhizobium sp. CW9]MCK1343160.1 MHS family MFS transporter [Bradyrhizobium sp. CW11]MCK1509524.1 MHS family MFS transporter [Bradyrhizobium sp. 18]MCK1568627.1 MHS family MFS transporter [Bradyrhizobium sp. 173]MCK1579670.1 MHS family MFS transporter [Bradyrhizobium sp. 168]MCK1634356.1 MHS family MFS transporter [Bradyrhizobium sp. 
MMSEPKADAPNLSIWTVVLASSAGTVIEWYDFYLYGSLAVFFSTLFYPANDPTAAVLISVATFATGFVIRPFGAILFGSLGDRLGRKHTFLLTLILMGISTTAVGLLPTYETIGFAAPVALVLLRLVQGLAIGGEYGGAAIYVAEHAPVNRRGFFTSFIQTTATLGFFVAILVVLACRLSLGEEGFRAWGWRIPFLLSALLVVFSIYLRLKLSESPVFEQMRQAGKVSRAPVRESFGTRQGLGYALYALFGATAGLGCVWYTGQFYALYFLQSVLKVDFLTANVCVAVALALGTPLIVVSGALSDRIGRRPLIVAGLLLAAALYVPIYMGIASATAAHNYVVVTALILAQLIFVALVYGPNAAFLVELFPARLRYTSLSLPYHIGTGIFGGFVPLISLSLVSYTGNIYAGLIYPIAIALMTAAVNVLCLPKTVAVDLSSEFDNTPAASRQIA